MNQVDQNLVTVVGGGVGGCGTIIVSTPEVIKLVAQPSWTERTTWLRTWLDIRRGCEGDLVCAGVHARNLNKNNKNTLSTQLLWTCSVYFNTSSAILWVNNLKWCCRVGDYNMTKLHYDFSPRAQSVTHGCPAVERHSGIKISKPLHSATVTSFGLVTPSPWSFLGIVISFHHTIL